MQRYIMRRALQGVVTLFAVTLFIFFFGRLIGNPLDLMLPDDATPEEFQHATEALGLDKPIHQQLYMFYVAALRGDLGRSVRYNRPVTQIFMERFPNTLRLAPVSMAIAFALAIPLGVLAAFFRGRLPDRLATLGAVLGMAIPHFWLGIVLIYLFAVTWDLLPPSGMGGPSHYVLPAATIGTGYAAGLMRLLRSSMLEVMGSDYVRTARSKGLKNSTVLLRHTMRNAVIPVFTLAGVLLAHAIAGALVTETVFAWPGVGRLTYEAVINRDYPLLQGVVMIAAIFVLVINLGVDVLYAYIDPRIRYT
ncbi:MAG: ABC transporter permease [Chloroflexota bacterium]|nr:ABC transporter permease [Chloroflexota bacterium]